MPSDISAPEPKTAGLQDGRTSEEMSRKLAKDTDNVQVLFVVGCDTMPTPSPPADNQAE